MVKKILIFVLAVTWVSADGIFESLGGQKVGTTSLVFLKIGIGTRATGLGGAFVGVADDPSTFFWNPGGVPNLGNSVYLNIISLPENVTMSFISVSRELGLYGNVGLFVIGLDAGYMKETDEYHPFGTGRYFHYGDYLIGANYSKKVTDRFSFGVNLKGFMEEFYGLHSYGFGFDVGTFYLVGYRDIRIGVSLSNLGPDVKPTGDSLDYLSFSIPIVYRMGVSGLIFEKFRASLELDKPSDNVETLKIGGEFMPIKSVSLYGGIKLNARPPAGGFLLPGLSFGLDAKFKRFKVGYSAVDMGVLGLVHRFSLEFRK